MTFFARDYTAQEVTGLDRLGFNIVNLTFLLIVIYGLFSLFQGKTGKSKTIAGVVVMVALLWPGMELYFYGSYNQHPATDLPAV